MNLDTQIWGYVCKSDNQIVGRKKIMFLNRANLKGNLCNTIDIELYNIIFTPFKVELYFDFLILQECGFKRMNTFTTIICCAKEHTKLIYLENHFLLLLGGLLQVSIWITRTGLLEELIHCFINSKWYPGKQLRKCI